MNINHYSSNLVMLNHTHCQTVIRQACKRVCLPSAQTPLNWTDRTRPRKKGRMHDTDLPKAAVQYPADSFVVNQTV